ncbi:FAD-binding protein [Gordonia sp. SID5947]|uniref:FAD-binding oxidoreductase n=1 Tax=Gordonia sp. SID5947 TaxID=2690315 RepID=UPI001370C25A|nr:FAD-binding oxidoreductase [Gordonia sp. SID5947]MYR07972.1 FAD-binding protein [Gordonia sp. SID5947]
MATVLNADFRGEVITAEHDAYDEARLIHNRRFDCRPAFIVRPRDTSDVAVAVRAAREAGLPLSVRGGGLHMAGFATNDGGIVIDLSSMRDVQVDSRARTASFGGGATTGDLQSAASRHGLGAITGVFAPTGVVGATLHGGIGALSNRHGWACDSVLEGELVTADGQILQVSDADHPDLMWALRGAGGAFGVVTRLVTRLYPLPTEYIAARLMYEPDALSEVLPVLDQTSREAGDGVTMSVLVMRRPESGDFAGRVMAGVNLSFLGGRDEADRVFGAFRTAAPPALTSEMTSLDFRDMHFAIDDYPLSRPMRTFWDEDFSAGLTADLGRQIAAHSERIADFGTAEHGLVELYPHREALVRNSAVSASFAQRTPGWTLSVCAGWDDPSRDAFFDDWVTGCVADLRTATAGMGRAYLNAVSVADLHRMERAYGADVCCRLAQLKHRYDPANVFRRALPVVATGD